jgi:hypothetical protein
MPRYRNEQRYAWAAEYVDVMYKLWEVRADLRTPHDSRLPRVPTGENLHRRLEKIGFVGIVAARQLNSRRRDTALPDMTHAIIAASGSAGVKSAPSSTMCADLPPNCSSVFFTVAASAARIARPVAVDPVKASILVGRPTARSPPRCRWTAPR